MQFTNQWARVNFASWRKLLKPLLGDDERHALEIGSFEGQSAIFFATNILVNPLSTITCVDPWDAGSDDDVYERFQANVHEAGQVGRIHPIRGPFETVFRGFKRRRFDFIYIDGDHEARAVLRDAVLAWELLTEDGLMLFDDYRWNHRGMDAGKLSPKIGIDCFLKCAEPYVDVLQRDRQVLIRRTRC